METNPSAELVLETVSAVMRTIRKEMREHRPAGISVQQFRALGVIQRHPGTSLRVAAQHLGLSTASTSKLIDGLVKLGLLTRTDAPEDRRTIVLNLTKAGNRALRSVRKAALGRLADMLAALDEPDRQAVVRAMNILRKALGDQAEEQAGIVKQRGTCSGRSVVDSDREAGAA